MSALMGSDAQGCAPTPRASRARDDAAFPSVSVLIPAHDEVGTVAEVVARVGRALAARGLAPGQAELVLVDDGSTDGTGEAIEVLRDAYPFLVPVRHRRQHGLTAALRTGFRVVRGETIVFLPADLESDPETDIPLLLDKLDEGYDAVAGWRQGRREGKVLASSIYNFVTRRLFGLQLHDMNWIKAFRREVMVSLPPLRGDWHRFILQIAAHQGFRVGEVATPWHRRRSGRSKFGISRIPKSLLDVLVIWFLLTFSRAPMRFFGGLGLALLALSTLALLWLLWLWLAYETQRRPIFWGASAMAVAGLVLILIGFIAELIVSQGEQLSEIERFVREERGTQGRTG